jgi:two-component system CheB/CheR fusion protein
MSSQTLKQSEETQSNFPIITLCASASGLEAFQAFFEMMPEGTGMAFLVVQHQKPNADSALAMIIQRHSAMPVQVMREGEAIQPNTIYVSPPGFDVTVNQGRFGNPPIF